MKSGGIPRTAAGGKGTIKFNSEWKPKGMRNKRKKKNRLLKVQQLADQREREERTLARENAYLEEWGSVNNDRDY